MLRFRMTPVVLLALAASVPARAELIYLNPSNQDANSVSGGGVESQYALINANIAAGHLRTAGYSVVVDQDFTNAPSHANADGADIFVSVHSNAGGGHGTESLYKTSGGQTLAQHLQDGLLSKLPYQSRGLKNRTDLHVLNSTNMYATLVEVVFHDCTATSGYTGHPPSESAFLRSSSGQADIGAGIAAGVCAYFGASCPGGTTTQTGFIKGVIYTGGVLTNHIPGTVSTNTGVSASYDGGSGVWSLEVPVGTYTVTASAPGYTSNSKSGVVVTAGQTTWSSIELAPSTGATGFLKGAIYTGGDVNNHIAGTVTVNTGASTAYDGGTGVWSFELAPGDYTVTASAPGYQTNSRACTVTAANTAWCSVELTPQTSAPDAGTPPRDAGPPVQPPPAPELVSPVGGATVYADSVVLTWTHVTDPQGYSVTYDIEVYNGAEMMGAPFVIGSGDMPGNITSVVPLPSDQLLGDHVWRVRAKSAQATGPWSGTDSFTVVDVPVSSSAQEPSSSAGSSSSAALSSSSSYRASSSRGTGVSSSGAVSSAGEGGSDSTTVGGCSGTRPQQGVAGAGLVLVLAGLLVARRRR